MKKTLSLLVGLFTLFSAHATVDGNHNLYLLVSDVQSGEYFVEKAPVIGCWGLPKGPELQQLTAEYKVPSNLGCGQVFEDNINALTCAKVLSAEESPAYSTFSKIELDISNCPDKNNSDFINGIKKVVKLNFATKEIRNPELILKL